MSSRHSPLTDVALVSRGLEAAPSHSAMLTPRVWYVESDSDSASHCALWPHPVIPLRTFSRIGVASSLATLKCAQMQPPVSKRPSKARCSLEQNVQSRTTAAGLVSTNFQVAALGPLAK